MPRLRHTVEQILVKLREADVALSKGQSVAHVCRALSITEHTYYRWHNEYGGLTVDQVNRLKDLERENTRLKRAVADLTLDKLIPKRGAEGNFYAQRADGRPWSTAVRCWASQNAGRAGYWGKRGPRSSISGSGPVMKPPLTAAIIDLARQYGRYRYRQVTGLLRNQGGRVNHKRVERIWRREDLKVPQKQPPRRQLWLTDGSCIRLRAAHPNHVWTYDFMATRTEDGRPVKLLTIVDEYTRECLAIDFERRLRSDDVRYCLVELFVHRGVPQHIRSDNGPKFVAKAVRSWLSRVGVQTLFITPGSLWENGSIESFTGKLRDKLLDTLWKVKGLVERWQQTYSRIRPHSALGYRPPAPETIAPQYA